MVWLEKAKSRPLIKSARQWVSHSKTGKPLAAITYIPLPVVCTTEDTGRRETKYPHLHQKQVRQVVEHYGQLVMAGRQRLFPNADGAEEQSLGFRVLTLQGARTRL